MNSHAILEIRNLSASIGDKTVLKDISLTIEAGSTHALLGRNGAGKSSLAFVLAGHPKYSIDSGTIHFLNTDVTRLPPEERAKLGMFLAFQNPVAIPGVTVANFLRSSLKTLRGIEGPPARQLIRKGLAELSIEESFMTRSLNDGFSGGERKRLETLQLRLFEPKLAILDETDSGLDRDALGLITSRLREFQNAERAFLIITHYSKLLKDIQPDFVHILDRGQIVETGGPEIVSRVDDQGFQ